MNYPRISIVTPSYNKADYLEKTILSVLSQNYPNLEYIIIDGGSTDGSVNIIKKYSEYLSYWVSEPDDGVYYAIKKGFEHSTGDIMAWIGADDMYYPNSFFVVAQIFSDFPQVSWLVGAQSNFDERGRTVNVDVSPYFNHLSFMMHKYKWIQQESIFWRRDLYERVGGVGTKYKLAGDFDLWMRFSRYEKMFITDSLIAGFRISKVQLSNDKPLYFQEAEDIIANEMMSEEEQKQLKILKRKYRLVAVLQKLKILNWHSINNRFMKWFVAEEKSHRFWYDFDQNKFVLMNGAV